jgi:hypothetical protein
MKIRLPKDLRGLAFPRLLTIELNTFDVDFLLPGLFFRILASGKQRARVVNDPKRLMDYLDKLARHPAVEGFDVPEGRRVLDRLVRTALITVGSVGQSRRGEQIVTVAPYSILTHKTGFPKESSRLRGVDSFLYQVLRNTIGSDEPLRQHFKLVFGRGVRVNPVPELGGTYDGTTELDTLTRLAIAYLDGFEAVQVGQRGAALVEPSCPALAKELGMDLLRFIFIYADRMPSQALSYNFRALINFELFVYTLKLITATNDLVRKPQELPPAMREKIAPSAPQIYLDFTGGTNALSRRMATECVRRDIESYERYLSSSVRLRQLDRYVEGLRHNAQRRSQIDAALGGYTSGPLYLQALLLLQEHPSIWTEIEASARYDEGRIRQDNRVTDDAGITDEPEWLDDSLIGAQSDLDRVVALILDGQNTKNLGNAFQWYRSVGGLTKPYGLLDGNLKGRQSWRYAASNDLLAVLVQLAAIRCGQNDAAGPQQQLARLEPIRLQDFQAFLSDRFGILVDRPPEPFAGAEYVAAARENLRAMLRRLRQMGIFGDLSDDFTVQRLTPPYAAAVVPTPVEA